MPEVLVVMVVHQSKDDKRSRCIEDKRCVGRHDDIHRSFCRICVSVKLAAIIPMKDTNFARLESSAHVVTTDQIVIASLYFLRVVVQLDCRCQDRQRYKNEYDDEVTVYFVVRLIVCFLLFSLPLPPLLSPEVRIVWISVCHLHHLNTK